MEIDQSCYDLTVQMWGGVVGMPLHTITHTHILMHTHTHTAIQGLLETAATS